MTVTTAFAAKDALLALLQTEKDDDLAGVDLWYSYEGQAQEMPREVIWLGEIEWQDESPSALGALKRVEEYKILLTIEVHNPGSTQKESNDRAKALATVVETLLRQRNPLGMSNIEHCGVEPQLLGEGSDADGRGTIFVMSVRVRARK